MPCLLYMVNDKIWMSKLRYMMRICFKVYTKCTMYVHVGVNTVCLLR